MANPVDYNVERENNIIKNIAKEIVVESSQNGVEVSQELANYLVKLKLLNPKNGFTAAEVMPRSLTHQLVTSIVEDLNQDTPAMNCIRLQVHWNSANLNVEELKKEYQTIPMEKAEPYFNELLNIDRGETSQMSKILAAYILLSQNLGNPNNPISLRETMAALHSVLKNRDTMYFFDSSEDHKTEFVKALSKKVTGIRLYLKMIGKGNEGIDDVKSILSLSETCLEDVQKYSAVVSARIQEVRDVISAVVMMDTFFYEGLETAEVFLPPDTDANDLKYLKQILTIMLQHSFYLSDLISILEEIGGNSNFLINKFEETLQKIQTTIRDRDMVPTKDVYDDFTKAGELWFDIQGHLYALQMVQATIKKLEEINKKEHFQHCHLEKVVHATHKTNSSSKDEARHKGDKKESLTLTGSVILNEEEDFQLEFRGFCAWTLFFAEGFLLTGDHQAGIFQYNDLYYSFHHKTAREAWEKDPHYYLMHIYEFLRHNPEMVNLLNVYDNLYAVKSLSLIKKIDRKIPTRTDECQTVLHPVEKFWDKDYTFSEWELKKRALTLSRLVKCVTKSVQTVSHSHYRASIGILAAPDKDKEVQTRKDNSCVHSTVAAYLYGLRGQREDKFKVIELTRPVEETCERAIVLEKGDPCRDRRERKPPERFPYAELACPPWATPEDPCKYSGDHTSDYSCEHDGEG